MAATHEVAIIGGGIVGTATAMALTNRRISSIIILEAESHLAAHQTGNNSGVIHSGLYYKPGSLKAKNCVSGREALYRFCKEYGIAHDQCGKLVVATSEKEVPYLEELERRGNANGLKGIRRLEPAEMHQYEPHVSGVKALHVPETGIVDYIQVTEKYSELVRNGGGSIETGAQVRSFSKEGSEIILETTAGNFRCKNLINCAGLQSDRIARLCGVEPALKIVPFRGEYYKIIPERQHLVNNLIYPVPNPEFPFLGVHFTRMVHGGVEAGPNAVFAFKREGYTKTSFSFKDTFETLTYAAFWKMVAKYWKTGMGEMYRSIVKGAFVKALQKLIPELKYEDVYAEGAGVRAQALEPNGFLVDDFRIVEAENMIHVLNAPSPAATASISIGEAIADMAVRNFGLSSKRS
jgi:L-2-hydroxyglutarate oxidase